MPSIDRQKTISAKIEMKGVGIHTGKNVRLTLLPAPSDTGIVFVRVDMPHRPAVKAELSNFIEIGTSPRRTSIGKDGVNIYTIEHLMACLSALGIDNIIAEIDSQELPAMDGSAKEFFEAIKSAGIKELDAPKKIFSIKEPVYVLDGDSSLIALPHEGFKISYTLDYNHQFLKCEYMSVDITEDFFKASIAPARTFCLEEESQVLIKQGLGKGADYNNTLVVAKDGVIKNKLRFENEFVRHKILDLIGDLYLLGQPIRGHVIAMKSGHMLNIKFVKKISLVSQKAAQGAISAPVNIDIAGNLLDINMIQKILPHRYPFLLVDRIVEFEESKRAVGIKNVTANEAFFQGHFPNRPVMPGVLIVEAMAQVAGVLMLAKKENQGKIAYFMGIDGVRFRRVVVPGDQLMMEVKVLKLKTRTGQIEAKAYVDGKLTTEANLMFSLAD